jgi:hypothetical protein
MSVFSGCISDTESNFADFSHLEDEEAQVQAIFNEALALKRQVRELNLSLTESESLRQNDMARMVHIIREKDEIIQDMTRRSEDAVSLRTELVSIRSSLESEVEKLREQLEEREREMHQHHMRSPAMLAMQGKIAMLEAERDELLRSPSPPTVSTRSIQTETEMVEKKALFLKGHKQGRGPADQSKLRLSVMELLKELRNLKAVVRQAERQ